MNNIIIKKIDIDIISTSNDYLSLIKENEYCIVNFKKIKDKNIDITDYLINFMNFLINNKNRVIIFGFLIFKNNILEKKTLNLDNDKLNNFILENKIYLKTYYSPNPNIELPRTYKNSHVLNLRSRCYIIKMLQNTDILNLKYDDQLDIVTDNVNYNFILNDINNYRIYKFTKLKDLNKNVIEIINVEELLCLACNIESKIIKENDLLKNEILTLNLNKINI